MRTLRDVSGNILLSVLRRMGYEPVRQRGSHVRITTQECGNHHRGDSMAESKSGKALSGILKSDAGHHGISVQELMRELYL